MDPVESQELEKIKGELGALRQRKRDHVAKEEYAEAAALKVPLFTCRSAHLIRLKYSRELGFRKRKPCC